MHALVERTIVSSPRTVGVRVIDCENECCFRVVYGEGLNYVIRQILYSAGACSAYGFSRVHGARVAGFLTMKGACHNTGPA